MMRVVVFASLIFAMSACSHGTHVEPGEPREPNARPTEAPLTDAGVAPGVAGQNPEARPDPSAITPPSPPARVKIMVRTNPPKVFVHWGKKKLGLTPLNFERPRDSGPVDLVLRLQGYFPVRTRAYTVKNDLVAVKMVKLENRMTVFGAKQELPPDGGTPLDPALDPNNLMKPPTAPVGTPPATTPITQ
jgi:hypothetical protein